jgi:hypothetical protein
MSVRAKFIFMVRRKGSLLKKIVNTDDSAALRATYAKLLAVFLVYSAGLLENGLGLSTNHSPLFNRVSFGTYCSVDSTFVINGSLGSVMTNQFCYIHRKMTRSCQRVAKCLS